MSNVSYTRFVYLDSNIYSHLAKNQPLQKPFISFLKKEDLCLAFGEGHLYELSKDSRLHQPVTNMLLSMPSAMIKTRSAIGDEEVQAHPSYRSDTLLDSGSPKFTPNILMNLFNSQSTPKARQSQINAASQMNAILTQLKSNFPPPYTRAKAVEYATYMVIQILAQNYYDFCSSFRSNFQNLHTEVFQSMKLHALVIYQKYYLQGRNPNERSDFGDLWHLAAIPYCMLAIMEKDQCQVLTQIKQHHDILNSTDLENIDFIKGL